MDRFSQGLKDPQDAPITGECENCGCELYEDEVFCVECEEMNEHFDLIREEAIDRWKEER